MRLEEMLNKLRKDKTLEFEFDFYGGGRGGRIYVDRYECIDYKSDDVVLSKVDDKLEPLAINKFMFNTEYYLIEKGIKFKDMEEGKKYQRYDSDDGLVYGKVEGLLFLFNVDEYSSLEMHFVVNMKFKEID